MPFIGLAVEGTENELPGSPNFFLPLVTVPGFGYVYPVLPVTLTVVDWGDGSPAGEVIVIDTPFPWSTLAVRSNPLVFYHTFHPFPGPNSTLNFISYFHFHDADGTVPVGPDPIPAYSAVVSTGSVPLRLGQRNDGLGPNGHPRLPATQVTASAPRVGNKNMLI